MTCSNALPLNFLRYTGNPGFVVFVVLDFLAANLDSCSITGRYRLQENSHTEPAYLMAYAAENAE